jgi:hypothetical protein
MMRAREYAGTLGGHDEIVLMQSLNLLGLQRDCGIAPTEADIRMMAYPPQSPAPGFGEKYWRLSGFPSHSLESGGGAFLIVIFGQIFA